jgi:hypothetical protein
MGQIIQKKKHLKNERELGRSGGGCWRLVVAIYAPCPSIFIGFLILNGCHRANF